MEKLYMNDMHTDPSTVFAAKAEKYAKYRWGYAPEAVERIFVETGIGTESVAADIGAGTGILTRELVGRVKRVFAVEPNPEMRAILADVIQEAISCRVIEGRAEATTLADDSVDLITVAQAVHWFQPEAAKNEFQRILKPGGWLAICRNYGKDGKLGEALGEIFPPDLDTEALMVGNRVPKTTYYQPGAFIQQEYPFQNLVSWEVFMGSLATTSSAPDEESPLYPAFEQRARKIFDRFSTGHLIELRGVTELFLGKMEEPGES